MRESMLHKIAVLVVAVALGSAVIVTVGDGFAGGASTAIAGVIAAEPYPSGTIPTGTMTITAIMDVSRRMVMVVSDGGRATHQPNNRPSPPIIASKYTQHTPS
jgi:hypothetical protein